MKFGNLCHGLVFVALSISISAQSSLACDAPEEQTAATREAVMAFLDAFRSGDQDAVAATLADDFLLDQAEGLPYGGRYEGADGWHDFVAQFLAAWEDMNIDVRRIDACGDTLYMQVDFIATSTVTGTTLGMPLLEVYRVRDGRIAALRPYYHDVHEVRRVAGAAGTQFDTAPDSTQ